MNGFIENLNEGRGKKMLQILFVEESKADHDKMENRPQVENRQSNFVEDETSSVPVLDVAHHHEKIENRPQVETRQSNFVEDETSSVPVLDVAHPNSEDLYILTAYNNENVTADDVLKGEFLFDDTNIELQEVQLVTEDNNNNQKYEEDEEVKTYDNEVNIVEDGNNLNDDDVSNNIHDYIPDENGNSSDSEYEEISLIYENLENNFQQQTLQLEQVQQGPQDQEIIEINRGTKKRLKNEKLWAKNVKKLKVNSGEAYQTKSGNLKQAKTVKEGCGDTCKLKCSENVDLEDRNKLLSDFLTLTDINRKRDFISKLMDEVKPKYSYKKDDSHRSANYSYNFIINRNKVKVCKKMFTDTLCISSTFLTTVKKKMSSTGVIEPDLRGKHLNQPKTDPQIIKDIIEHINSFARIESHYCRSDTKREYIDGDLNQAEMYRLYKRSCQDKGTSSAKQHKYEEILTTKFNIGFFQPKKDQCSFCESYKNSSEEERIKMKQEMDLHKKEKELSREEKKHDKEASREANSNLIVSCFDLQAVVQLPKGQVSTFYYKRKLNAFDFTIYDATNKQGYCYIWHEACAKRGALEISSFLYNYLKEHCCGTGKRLVFYSDNCSGQNKNHLLLTMYLYAVKTLDIPSITHKYLIVGHTQNEGDVMHSLIERQMKLATKKTPLYVPSQLVAVMQMAKKGEYQFVVKEMDTQDVLDWRGATHLFGKNFQYATSGERIVWANVKMFEVRKDTGNTVFYKTSYEQKDMKSFNLDDKIVKKKDGSIQIIPRGLLTKTVDENSLQTPRRTSRKAKAKQCVDFPLNNDTLNTPTLRVKQAYPNPPGISVLKKADLLSLCRENLIPCPYHPFFENLRTSTIGEVEEQSEDDA